MEVNKGRCIKYQVKLENEEIVVNPAPGECTAQGISANETVEIAQGVSLGFSSNGDCVKTTELLKNLTEIAPGDNDRVVLLPLEESDQATCSTIQGQ